MIRIGTCSWAEKTLVKNGDFYPLKSLSAAEKLQFYADRFNTVEVDSSYYAVPSSTITQLWHERTPAGFTFHIKAYGALTGHGISPKSLPEELRVYLSDAQQNSHYFFIKDKNFLMDIAQRFMDALEPLKNAGKLGVIVFQYPPWFVYNDKHLDTLLEHKHMMEGCNIAVEFRHGSWLSPQRRNHVFRFLRDNELTYIIADEPQYGSFATVPFVPEVTSDTVYFRLHGRNKKNWLKKGIETSLRYDYLYTDDELQNFIQPIEEMQSRTRQTFVMFNNCHGSSAVRNALTLRDILFQGAGK